MKMTEGFLDKLAAVIADAIGLGTKPLRERITVLETQIAELMANGLLQDKGVYSDAETYRKGDIVSRGGMWVAQKHEVKGIRPGDEPANVPDRAWRLVVQKGRDGRDGKDLR